MDVSFRTTSGPSVGWARSLAALTAKTRGGEREGGRERGERERGEGERGEREGGGREGRKRGGERDREKGRE